MLFSNFKFFPVIGQWDAKRFINNCKENRGNSIFSTVIIFMMANAVMAQEQPTDSLEGKKVVLDEVFVSAIRVTKESPVTFSNLSKDDIAPRNLGQDIPILMNFLPSVGTT